MLCSEGRYENAPFPKGLEGKALSPPRPVRLAFVCLPGGPGTVCGAVSAQTALKSAGHSWFPRASLWGPAAPRRPEIRGAAPRSAGGTDLFPVPGQTACLLMQPCTWEQHCQATCVCPACSRDSWSRIQEENVRKEVPSPGRRSWHVYNTGQEGAGPTAFWQLAI